MKDTQMIIILGKESSYDFLILIKLVWLCI